MSQPPKSHHPEDGEMLFLPPPTRLPGACFLVTHSSVSGEHMPPAAQGRSVDPWDKHKRFCRLVLREGGRVAEPTVWHRGTVVLPKGQESSFTLAARQRHPSEKMHGAVPHNAALVPLRYNCLGARQKEVTLWPDALDTNTEKTSFWEECGTEGAWLGKGWRQPTFPLGTFAPLTTRATSLDSGCVSYHRSANPLPRG